MFYDGAVPSGGDAGVSSYSSGRLSGSRYSGRSIGSGQCSQTFVEQYSYTNYGAMVKKRVKLIRGAASGVLESVAEYDGEGRLKSVTYPVTNRKVQYGFNSRGLPETLTDVTGGGSTVIVSLVLYGAAGEVTTFVSGGGTETRSYNSNGQLTSLVLPGRGQINYNYPAAGQNNGKIESMSESGEIIWYQSDAQQRLTSATGSGWGQTYSYDVFGNMYNKQGSGTAPAWSGTIDAATNRLTAGVTYDANGNQTNVPLVAGSEMPDALSTMSYDVSNRLIRADSAPGTARRADYDYDPGNKRIYEKRTVNGFANGEWAYFFGITGQRLGRYTFTVAGSVITFAQSQASVWFGGKLVQKLDGISGSYAWEDRLGSVGKYLPYGESRAGSPAADNEKFATYTRDAGTGLDYADQRWHVPGSGRFLTSDPYQASGGPADPGSWNRFGYVIGDPVGSSDRSGLYAEQYDDWFGPHWWLWEYLSHKGSGLACLSGACMDINGPMPVVRTGKWQTADNILNNRRILQMAAETAIAIALSQHPIDYITHLVVEVDCIGTDERSNRPARLRKYAAYQGLTRRAGRSSGVTISEVVVDANGSPANALNPLSVGPSGSGVFRDSLSFPGLAQQTAGTVVWYQYFTVSIAGTVFQNIPVSVAGQYSQAIRIDAPFGQGGTQDRITINGDTPPHNCTKEEMDRWRSEN